MTSTETMTLTLKSLVSRKTSNIAMVRFSPTAVSVNFNRSSDGYHVKVSVYCALSGVEGSGDEDSRGLNESDPDTDASPNAGRSHFRNSPYNMTLKLLAVSVFQRFEDTVFRVVLGVGSYRILT